MQPYTYTRLRQTQQIKRRPPPTKTGHNHHLLVIFIVLFLVLLWGFAFFNMQAHAASPEIKSGLTGLCLDDYANSSKNNSKVDAWQCNNTPAQDWIVSLTSIKHGSDSCLSVLNDATSQNSLVVLAPCSSAPGQVWLRDGRGYQNPNSRLCLNDPGNSSGVQLRLASCQVLAGLSGQWTPVTVSGAVNDVANCNIGTEGQRVACNAVKQWTIWQSGRPSHDALLNLYSHGNGYEEWCADFVSYVYKEAGFPFSTGERGSNGWDEYNANNIQNDNFTIHYAGTGYLPRPGDVAFFDYTGGHVEIVVSGGSQPTFVYGDSATIDPTTGNGQMEANTIMTDGALGQVAYYLTPN